MELSRPVVVQHHVHLTLERPIDMELNGCDSKECYTHFVTLNVPLTHDL